MMIIEKEITADQLSDIIHRTWFTLEEIYVRDDLIHFRILPEQGPIVVPETGEKATMMTLKIPLSPIQVDFHGVRPDKEI